MVLDTRTAKATGIKRRRYECGNLHRFATMEYVDVDGLIGRSSTTKKKDERTSTPHDGQPETPPTQT